jgi:hypothetical protein
VTAVVQLLEGLQTLAVIALPQNCAYRDMTWPPANASAYEAGGTPAVPIVADNTIELSQAEVTICPGAGGPGVYDHTITSGLTNARLLTLPIDGTLGNVAAQGAGNTQPDAGGAGGGGGGL